MNSPPPIDAPANTIEPISKKRMEKVVLYGEPELSKVTKFFVEWTGVDESYLVQTDDQNFNPIQTVRMPWSVKRLRNGCAFSCSCNDFKTKCTRGTFVNREKAIVFSKSEEYDQIDGCFDFSYHSNNVATNVGFCDHIAKVVCTLCQNQDDAFLRCGIAAQ